MLQTSTTYANELSYSFYDKKARPIRTYSTNFLGGYTYTDSKLNFVGKQEYTITYHKRLPGDAELKTKDIFTYSPQGRLLTQTHQINDGNALRFHVASLLPAHAPPSLFQAEQHSV